MPVLVVSVMFGCLISACRNEHEESSKVINDVMIAQVGDSVLYRQQVVARIPSGLTPSDSAAMFDAIVKNWVESNLLLDYANKNLSNTGEIDEMVNRYRNMLIIEEYKRNLGRADKAVSQDSVRKWYDNHRDSYKLERPLLKGVFVKVAANSAAKEKIEALLASDSRDALKELEDEFAASVAQYSDFRDDWVDWDAISDQIPSNLGDANEFLADNQNYKTDYKGMTYFLVITDYIPAGEDMPYEYASKIITDNMLHQSAFNTEKQILKTIYDQALKEGKLIIGSDHLFKQ